MTYKLLFCSIAFPPKNDPESLQAGKYYKGLSNCSDLKMQVLTSKNPTLYMEVDPNMKGFERVDQIVLPLYENRYTNYLFRKTNLSFVNKPDSKFSFYKQARKGLRKIDSPDIIYSRSMPLSSTMMALKLKQKLQVPWILHLSDPWTWSPLHTYTPKVKKWHKRMEALCFKEADLICLTSHKAIERYKELYPEIMHKFSYYPNVLDQENVNNKAPQFTEKLRITYTGGLAGPRTAEPLLQVLKKLFEQKPELEKMLDVRFAGPMDRKNEEIFRRYQLPFVRHLGLLSYEKAVDLQFDSEVLVVIDNPVEKEEDAVFFPSKVLDYFAAAKRVFAITTPNSCTEEILKGVNADVCYREDLFSITNVIENALLAFNKGTINYFENRLSVEEYTLQYQTRKLCETIKNLLQTT